MAEAPKRTPVREKSVTFPRFTGRLSVVVRLCCASGVKSFCTKVHNRQTPPTIPTSKSPPKAMPPRFNTSNHRRLRVGELE